MDIVKLLSQHTEQAIPAAEKSELGIDRLKNRIAWAAGRGDLKLVARLRVAKAVREEQTRKGAES